VACGGSCSGTGAQHDRSRVKAHVIQLLWLVSPDKSQLLFDTRTFLSVIIISFFSPQVQWPFLRNDWTRRLNPTTTIDGGYHSEFLFLSRKVLSFYLFYFLDQLLWAQCPDKPQPRAHRPQLTSTKGAKHNSNPNKSIARTAVQQPTAPIPGSNWHCVCLWAFYVDAHHTLDSAELAAT